MKGAGVLMRLPSLGGINAVSQRETLRASSNKVLTVASIMIGSEEEATVQILELPSPNNSREGVGLTCLAIHDMRFKYPSSHLLLAFS